MKAKVIETGEIVDITIFIDRFGGPKRYWDSKNKKEYSKSKLDFNIDTQISKEPIKAIDWEQRRYEITKDENTDASMLEKKRAYTKGYEQALKDMKKFASRSVFRLGLS